MISNQLLAYNNKEITTIEIETEIILALYNENAKNVCNKSLYSRAAICAIVTVICTINNTSCHENN